MSQYPKCDPPDVRVKDATGRESCVSTGVPTTLGVPETFTRLPVTCSDGDVAVYNGTESVWTCQPGEPYPFVIYRDAPTHDTSSFLLCMASAIWLGFVIGRLLERDRRKK